MNVVHLFLSMGLLSQVEILETLAWGLIGQFTNQRVLALIPDHTFSLPLSGLFRVIVDILADMRQLDFMIALGVLAHGAHLRGSGVVENGIEKPNVRLTLASQIAAEDCAQLNLSYLDPAKIDIDDFRKWEAQGILCVPRAGEYLYRQRKLRLER